MAASNDKLNQIRILVFGSSGAGKTSLINLLTNNEFPVGTGLGGCTFESNEITFFRNLKNNCLSYIWLLSLLPKIFVIQLLKNL